MSKFVIYKGSDQGEQYWRWRLKDNNGEPIAKSEEPFLKTSIVKSIKTIRTRVNEQTPIFKDESPTDTDKGVRFEYFQGKDSQWYWRLKAANNELMAVGGEGFVSEANVKRSIENVRLEILRAEITWENKEDNSS